MISVKPEEEAEELTGRQENERPFALPASLYHAALITFTDDETERERERERERESAGKGGGGDDDDSVLRIAYDIVPPPLYPATSWLALVSPPPLPRPT
jgi:hypothetical protein